MTARERSRSRSPNSSNDIGSLAPIPKKLPVRGGRRAHDVARTTPIVIIEDSLDDHDGGHGAHAAEHHSDSSSASSASMDAAVDADADGADDGPRPPPGPPPSHVESDDPLSLVRRAHANTRRLAELHEASLATAQAANRDILELARAVRTLSNRMLGKHSFVSKAMHSIVRRRH